MTFVAGGANLIDKVSGNRIAVDNNEYLIAALKLIRDNPQSLPKNSKEFGYDDYYSIKHSNSVSKGFKGYVGFALSYGGKWFGGWCRDSTGARDYVKEAYNNAIQQSQRLQGIKFACKDFQYVNFTPQSLIYVDPPYINTTNYTNNTIDYAEFWNWVRKLHKQGHTIFVSEYTAPNDFNCIWSKTIASSLTQHTGSKTGVEKLFTKSKVQTKQLDLGL